MTVRLALTAVQRRETRRLRIQTELTVTATTLIEAMSTEQLDKVLALQMAAGPGGTGPKAQTIGYSTGPSGVPSNCSAAGLQSIRQFLSSSTMTPSGMLSTMALRAVGTRLSKRI